MITHRIQHIEDKIASLCNTYGLLCYVDHTSEFLRNNIVRVLVIKESTHEFRRMSITPDDFMSGLELMRIALKCFSEGVDEMTGVFTQYGHLT